MIQCSVIIITWNRRKELDAALASIFLQTIADSLEVILIDNGSDDGTTEWLQEAYASQLAEGRLRLFGFKQNKGACQGRNAGIKLSRGEYICFLDSDAEILSDDAMEKCIAKIETGDVRACSVSIWFDREKTRGFQLGGHVTSDGHIDAVRTQTVREEPMFVSTCFAVWQKSLLEELGGFDPFYFWGIEDVDLALRAHINSKRGLKKAATRYFVIEDSHVLHEMSQSGRHFTPGDFEPVFHALERQRLYFVLSTMGLGAFFKTLVSGPFKLHKFREQCYRIPLQLKHKFYAAVWYPFVRLVFLPVDLMRLGKDHLADVELPDELSDKSEG